MTEFPDDGVVEWRYGKEMRGRGRGRGRGKMRGLYSEVHGISDIVRMKTTCIGGLDYISATAIEYALFP